MDDKRKTILSTRMSRMSIKQVHALEAEGVISEWPWDSFSAILLLSLFTNLELRF